MWTKISFIFLVSTLFCAEGVRDRFYPWYHLAPPYGWMNDPNGFSYFQDEIHLFYQFNPKSSFEPGIAHWGHAKSKDYFNWEHLPIAMYPDKDYDKDGVFSGSAVIENGTMYLFYTGQVKYGTEENEHTNRQLLSRSTDGLKFQKYDSNPIIPGDEYQPNFRDPKVWEKDGKYYMVLGNSYRTERNETAGRALLFTAENKTKWNFASILDESDGTFGYMWECPDLFEINGTWVLMFSPQGVKPQGDKFRNLYQTGYKIGSFNYDNNQFTPESEFFELDHGTDFYATQSYLDERNGQRILVGWFDMWEENYPERDDGFTGQMTLPRKISLSQDKKLLQWPVDEIELARDVVLRSGKATCEDSVTLENNVAEIKIEADLQDLILYLESQSNEGTMDSVTINYSRSDGTVTVDRGGDNGLRRTEWKPENIQWLIYLDRSSIELFCGKGEVTFSCRYFPQGNVTVRLGNGSEVNEMTITSMKRTTPIPK